MISFSTLCGATPFGKGVSTSFFVSLFILFFGLASVLSAQSATRGASGSAVINADAWEALGGGLDAPANAMVTVGDYIYVAGGFQNANNNPAIRFAKFNHTNDTWEAINGPQEEVKAMVAHDGKIYIGGFFDNVDGEPYTYFAIYTIPTEIPGGWSAPTDLPDGDVLSMAVLGDYLYVGGSFNNIGALVVDGAARYHLTNRTWERIGGVSSDYFGSSFGSGSVSAITTDGTHVFFAGSFTVNLDGTDVPGVIQYTPGTNTWQALGQGIDESSSVNSLATYDGKLYAGSGDMSSGPFFEDGSIELSNIGVFNYNAVDRASEEWVSFGDALDNSVNQLKVYNGKLFVAGTFSSVDGNVEKGIAMYDFANPGWSGFGGGLVNSTFGAGESIGFAGGKLYASGGFDTAGGEAISRIARWTADFGADQSGGGSGGDGGGSGGGDGGGPVTFALTAPSDGATGVSVEPLFTWNAPEGVTVDSYTLEIFDNPTLTAPAYFQNDPFDPITTTTYQYDGSFFPLPGNTTFYWRVTGYNNLNEVVANTETPFSFKTEVLDEVIPTQIAKNAGDGQSATAGTAVAVAPSVLVTDDSDNPVPGVEVTFAVATGGGTVVPTTAVLTNAQGIATVTSWTLGTTAGENTLTATSEGLTGSPLTFTATGTAGTPTQITKNAGDGQSATIETAVAVAPSVLVTDANDNPVAGVEVTFAVASGGGSVSPEDAVTTNAQGIATVTSWTLGTTAGENTLTATSTGLTGSPVTFTATGTTPKFYLAENGVTIVCTDAEVGETGVVNGVTYTKRDRIGLNQLVTANNNNPEFTTTCTSGVINMSHMFSANPDFNQPIDSWDVSSVTDMFSMFANATSFNQDINSWDVGSVTNMRVMFLGANAFNKDISTWNVSNVTNMSGMFYEAIAFDQDISEWNVSSVVDMNSMFYGTESFDKDISIWNVSSVTDMGGMFYNASAFNRDLRLWCVPEISSEPSDFATNSALLTTNYPFWGRCVSVAGTGTLLSGTDLSRVNNGVEAATISVQLKDVDGTNIKRAGIEVTFATTRGTLSSTTATTNESGLANVSLTSEELGDASVTASITGPNFGTVNNGSPVSVTFEVPQPTQIVFTTEPQTIGNSGGTSDVMTIELRDSQDNPATRAEATTVTLSSDPSTGVTFRNENDDTDITEIMIPAGLITGSFKVKTTVPGTTTITVSANGLQVDTQTLITHPFASGSGTEGDPFVITNVTQLQAMEEYLSSHFELGNDIDATSTASLNSEKGFKPVGTYENPFKGSLDGKGFKIHGLTINRGGESGENYIGLFGESGQGSKISNVSLEMININGRAIVGGLVGYTTGGSITNSYATGSVTGSRSSVGGLVGFNATGEITNSYSSVSVSGNESVGGLVGSNGYNNGGSITNSYSTGSVTVSSGTVGGLVGYNEGEIKNSYSIGSVSGNLQVGGLVGSNISEITNSYWDTLTSGLETSGGGEGKTTSEMKTQATFVDWDFDDIWDIDPNFNYGYPRLRSIDYPEQPVVSDVVITGELTVGDVLTATYTYSGPEGTTEQGTVFQWFRTDDGSGANKAAIEGATVKTYTTTVADKDKYLSVRITPVTNTSVQGVAVESAPLGPIILNPPQAFELRLPIENAENTSITPTFTWDKSQNATSYILLIKLADVSGFVFESEAITPGEGTEESYTLSQNDKLKFGFSYEWRVIATNGVDEIATEWRIFSTEAEGLTLGSPDDETVFASLDELEEQIFNWSIKTNNTYDASFLFMFDRSFPIDQNPSTSANMVLNYQGASIDDQKVNRTHFVHGYTYHWRVDVRVEDQDNNGLYLKSGFQSFTILPEQPALSSPNVGAAINSSIPFQWSTEERFITTGRNYPGKFIVQILFDPNTAKETLTTTDGFQFEVAGTDALTESFTLEQLFSGLSEDDTRTIGDLFLRAGETLHWRVKINPTYEKFEGDSAPPAPVDRETAWSDTRAFTIPIPPFASGNGKESDPFIITTLDQLQAMKDYLWAHFELGNDIDASATKNLDGGKGFEPVGNFNNRFIGSLDGKGYKITGLNINLVGENGKNFVGLFGVLGESARINNVLLENIDIEGDNSVGGLAGQSYGKINNSYVIGTVKGKIFVGLLIGNSGESSETHNSFSTGTVVGVSYVGGLIGAIAAYYTNVFVSNSYFNGSVTGSNSYVGGFTGNFNSGLSSTITNSYSTGPVNGTVTGTQFVGGFAGGSTSTVNNSFWDTQTSGQTESKGGSGKSTAEMKTQATFTDAGWDFEEIWAIDPDINDGYPYLQNLVPALPIISDVVITGDLKVGEGLTATYSYSGPTGTTEQGTVFQWFRSDDGSGTNKASIEGSTDKNYTIVAADKDKYLSVRVTPKTSTSVVGLAVESGYVGPILEAIVHPFASGSGTVEDPFVIRNVTQLQAMEDYLTSHFVLGNDIDASSTADVVEFRPVGTQETPFFGSVDGKGFKITGLTINRGNEPFVGLFGRTGTGSNIINLSLEQVNLKGTSFVGGLAGENSGSITNSYSSGEVTGTQHVGGLVGGNTGLITDSYSSGSVTGLGIYVGSTFVSNREIGGLVGYNTNSGSITNSYSNGSVTGFQHVGGLVGGNIGLITDSYSSGSVTGLGVYVGSTFVSSRVIGGLVGINDNSGSITNSYSSGSVTGAEAVGGLVGDNTGPIESSYWDTQTSGQATSAGGVGKTTADMKKQATFVDWDFDTVWQISEGKSYPYLRNPAQNPPPGIFIPNVPVLSDVIDRDVTVFSWTADPTARYVIEIHDNKEELEAVGPGAERTTPIIFKGQAFGNSISIPSDKFSGGKTYYWRVSQPVPEIAGYFVTSEIGEFMPTMTPDVISVTNPGNNATDVSPSELVFKWEPDLLATHYVIQLDAVVGTERFTIFRQRLPASGDEIQEYIYDGDRPIENSLTYSWRVIGYNGDKPGKINDWATFSTPYMGGLSVETRASEVQAPSTVFSKQPRILILDGNGNRINTEASVTVELIQGEGELFGTKTVSSATGLAAFDDLGINGTPGVYKLLFSSENRGSVVIDVLIVSNAGSILTIKSIPDVIYSGLKFVEPLEVLISDLSYPEFINYAYATASISSEGTLNSDVKLIGTTTVKFQKNGIATFRDLAIVGPSGNYTLTVTLTGGEDIGTFSSTTKEISISNPPSDINYLVANIFSQFVVSGEPFKTQPTVLRVDADGNIVSSSVTEVSVVVNNSASLSGATKINTVSGSAEFTDLKVDAPTGAYTLTFFADGVVASSRKVSVVENATALVMAIASFQSSLNSDLEIQINLSAEICRILSLNTAACSLATSTSTASKSIGNIGNAEISNTTDGLIPIIWNAPKDVLFEQFPVTHYPIEFRETGSENWTVFARPQSADTVAVLTGLKLDTTYEVRIAFSNENGTGDFSDPIEIEAIDLQTILDFIDDVAAEIIATSIEVEEIPTEFTLFQNYPNPFNPTTTIRFALPVPSEVQLEVYSILGQRIAVLSTGLKPAGYHSLQLDASRWASGTYIYRLRAGDRVFTKKLLLLK